VQHKAALMASRSALRAAARALSRAAASRPAAAWGAADAPAARGTAAAAAAAWSSSRGFSSVVNVVRDARPLGAGGACARARGRADGLGPCVSRCRAQHRDTPDNNATTPFEFTPENSKMARARAPAAGAPAP
jgi:hypothetical protein